MADLNLDLSYFEHPKTVRLIGLLGRGAEVLPLKLWAYCGRVHAAEGRLMDYATQEIESLAGWWGKSGEAVAALVKVGFLDRIEGGFEIHGWQEHAGHLIAFKKRAKNAAEARWSKYATSRKQGSATSMPQGIPHPTYLPNLPTNGGEHPVLVALGSKVGYFIRWATGEKAKAYEAQVMAMVTEHGQERVIEYLSGLLKERPGKTTVAELLYDAQPIEPVQKLEGNQHRPVKVPADFKGVDYAAMDKK